MHKIRELKRWVALYEEVKREIDDLGVIFEFFKAKEVSEEELEAQFKKAPKRWRSSSSRTCSVPKRTPSAPWCRSPVVRAAPRATIGR
jgi:DNA-binding protein H-NS